MVLELERNPLCYYCMTGASAFLSMSRSAGDKPVMHEKTVEVLACCLQNCQAGRRKLTGNLCQDAIWQFEQGHIIRQHGGLFGSARPDKLPVSSLQIVPLSMPNHNLTLARSRLGLCEFVHYQQILSVP